MIENYSYLTADGTKFIPEEYNNLLNKVFVSRELSSAQVPRITSVTWSHQNKRYDLHAQPNGIPVLIYDHSGLINTERTKHSVAGSLVVYNPDASERFRISPPSISSDPISEESHFYYVRFNKESRKYECLFFDGKADYIGDLNLFDGNITNIRITRV